jgi:hypothetical protein
MRIYCSTFNGRLLSLVGALALTAAAAAAQNVPRPDCIIDVTLTAAGQSAGGAGTCGVNINGVYEWRLTYKSSGFTALSLIVQSAPPDAGGVCTAAAWVAFAGTIETGVNPNTATTSASSSFKGFEPCVRVTLTSKVGTGTVTGQLYGCRSPGCSISDQSLSVTIPTPLPVDGPTAAGAAPTTPPVLVAGQDGAPGLIRTVQTDSSGRLIPAAVSTPNADGLNNTNQSPAGPGATPFYFRTLPYVFDSSTYEREFACNFPAVAIVPPGTTRVILGTLLKTTKICHYHASINALTDVTISSGTGSLCSSGIATIDSFKNVTAFAMDFSPLSPLKANAVADDICFSMPAGTTTAAFTVIYAQF